MNGQSQKVSMSIRRFLSLGPYEEDEGFRELLQSFAKQGMRTAGLLGVVSVIIFVFSHILILGKEPVWTYSGLDPQQQIMLSDKCLIFRKNPAVPAGFKLFSASQERLKISLRP